MQKNSEKIRFRHRLENILFNAFIMGVRLSPLSLRTFHERLLLFLFHISNKKYSRLVTKNLKIAFPETAAETITSLKKKVFRHFAKIFVEIAYLFSHKKPGKILGKIEVNNLANLVEALNKKKGAIVFSGHFGNWELVPYILKQQLGRNIFGIAKRMRNPLVDRKVKDFRDFMGLSLIDKDNSIRTVLKALENNEVIFYLTDHHAIDREAAVVNFFGRPVNAVTSVARLHIKKGIPLVPLFVHYEPGKIVLDICQAIHFEQTGNMPADIENVTGLCLGIIEKEIKKYPEQWFWFHNRWRLPQPGSIKEK